MGFMESSVWLFFGFFIIMGGLMGLVYGMGKLKDWWEKTFPHGGGTSSGPPGPG